MFYKKVIAFSIAAALIFASGCTSNDNGDVKVVPQGEAVSNGDITIINGENLDEPPTEEEKININIGLYNGASALSAAHLLDNSEKGVSYENYSSNLYTSVKDIETAFEKGEIVAAAMPFNEAAKLYNTSSKEYKVAMINSLFNYCIAQNGSSITSDIASLENKTITVAENDSIGKIVLNKLIKDYDISNCNITTVADINDITSGLADGSINLALTQEPYISTASVKNPNVTMGIDLYDLWFEKGNVDIVTGCLVVSNDFIKSNEKAFVYFLKDYDASVILSKKNIDDTAQLAAKFGLTDSAASAKSGIPGCGITAKKNNDMTELASEYFNFINSVDVSAIGGKIPASNFYYTE